MVGLGMMCWPHPNLTFLHSKDHTVEKDVSTETEKQAGAGLKDFGILIVSLVVFVPIVWAGVFGFFCRGIYYGFGAGIEIFDDFFETEASEKRKRGSK